MHLRALSRLAVFAPLLVAGCKYDICFDPKSMSTGSVGAAQSAIIGGSVDEANHATVALLSTRSDGSHALCSGTVIAKHGVTGYVLTAAHCVTGTVDHVYDATDWIDCTPAGDASRCRASYTPTAWKADPDYDADQFLNDFAVVTFTGATDATEVVPAVEGPDALVATESVELSGFGRTYSGANDPALYQHNRNHVVLPIDTVLDSWIRYDASQGKTACFGDSGGPTYAHVGGVRRVVGVASAADATCEHVALYGRVSSVYEAFIQPIIASALASDCNTCLQSNMSSVAACQAERDACGANADCAALLSCVGVCVVPDQSCYVLCATPSLAGTPAFNQLANCTACSSCSTACSVQSCSSPATSTSTSSGTGGSTSTGVGGASASGTGGAGGAPGTGSGAGGSESTASGGAGSTSQGSGGGSTGSGENWLGAGGFGASTSSSSGAGAGGALSAPSSGCVPLQIKCEISQPGEGDDDSKPGEGVLLAVALVRLTRRGRRPISS